MKTLALLTALVATQTSSQAANITFGMETDLSPSSTAGDVGGATATLSLGNPDQQDVNYSIAFTDGNHLFVTRLADGTPIGFIGSNGLGGETGRNLGPVENAFLALEITTGSTGVSFDSLTFALDGPLSERQSRTALYDAGGGQIGATQQATGGERTITVNRGATEADGSGSFNGIIPPNSTETFYLDTGFNIGGDADTIAFDSISLNLRPVGLATFGMETDLTVSSVDGDVGGATATLSLGNLVQEGVNYSIAFSDGDNSTVTRIDGEVPLGFIGSNGLPGGTGATLGSADDSLFVLEITTGPSAVRFESLIWALDETSPLQQRFALFDSNLKQIGGNQQSGGTGSITVDGGATETDGSGSFDGVIPAESTVIFYLDTGVNFGAESTEIITDSISLVLNPAPDPGSDRLDASVVCTGPKAGVFTVDSKIGFTYRLRVSETLPAEGLIILELSGDGSPLELPFDDSAFSLPRSFFWVEETPTIP